jgi:hypothetical protein
MSEFFAMKAPDPPHLTPNLYFGAFRTVWLLNEHWCKTGRTDAINAQIRAAKSCRNFLRQMHPIHPIGPQTHVLVLFGLFCYCMNFGAKWVLEFFATNAPDPPHWTHFGFGAFETVSLLHELWCKTGVGIFRNKRTGSTPLDPKLMFWGISGRFVTAQTSVQNGLNRCH